MINEQRRQDLEAAGFCISDAEDFLEISQSDLFDYKGYKANIFFNEDDNMFYGKVENDTCHITFGGKTISEANEAFQDYVDDILEYCKEY